jgi:hypothetical protein
MEKQKIQKAPRPLGLVMVKFTTIDSAGCSGAPDEPSGQGDTMYLYPGLSGRRKAWGVATFSTILAY